MSREASMWAKSAVAGAGRVRALRDRPPHAAVTGGAWIVLDRIGSIFLGGVFGLFTALTRGLGDVDPRYTEGAVATYAAVTADEGAYGLSRRLAMLALVGIAIQAIALWRAPGIPHWAPVVVAIGCTLFLSFWDVDNLMFAGTLCLVAGFVPVAHAITCGAREGP